MAMCLKPGVWSVRHSYMQLAVVTQALQEGPALLEWMLDRYHRASRMDLVLVCQ